MNSNTINYDVMTNNLSYLICLVLVVPMFSCEVVDEVNETRDFAELVSGLAADDALGGNWEVTYFEDDGVEDAGEFDGMTFVFADNGDFIISYSGDTTVGRWSVGDESATMTIDLTEENFEVFPQRDELEDLGDDEWLIVEFDGTTLRLVEEEGAELGDAVSFTKM